MSDKGARTKVHRVVLLIVDHDDLGAEDVVDAIEHTHYPNRCISPSVMRVDTEEVVWDDHHPLNRNATRGAEFDRLFGGR